MPHTQTVYTTEEVEEIVQDYEDKLHRLKADKKKVEREKEMLRQKISRLLQPLVAEFYPGSLQSRQIPG